MFSHTKFLISIFFSLRRSFFSSSNDVNPFKQLEINNHKKTDIDNLYTKLLKSSGFKNKK